MKPDAKALTKCSTGSQKRRAIAPLLPPVCMALAGLIDDGSMTKALVVLLCVSLCSCGFWGREVDERWFLKNSDALYDLAAEALSFRGLHSVSGSEPWKDNVFKRIRSDPTSSEVERYNQIHTRLKDLKIESLSISSDRQTVSFVTYDSGVFGDIYQSIVYSRMPEKSIELTTPEVWSCRELKAHWYMCNGA